MGGGKKDTKKDSKKEKGKKKERRRGGEKASDTELRDLSDHLSQYKLWMKIMDDDGNCLFRSIADQLFGSADERHIEVRHKCVEYLIEHKDEYEFFVDEDEGPYEEYLENMRKDGVWGGQLELMGACKALGVHLLVFQADKTSYEMRCDTDDADVPCVLLAYLGGEHYNSVRYHDMFSGPSSDSITLKRMREEILVSSDGNSDKVLTELSCKENDDSKNPDSAYYKFQIATNLDKLTRHIVDNDEDYYEFKNMLDECLPPEQKDAVLANTRLLVDTFRRVVWGDDGSNAACAASASKEAEEEDNVVEDVNDDENENVEDEPAKVTKAAKKPSKRQLKNAKKSGNMKILIAVKNSKHHKPAEEIPKMRIESNVDRTTEEGRQAIRGRIDEAVQELIQRAMQIQDGGSASM